MLVEPLMPHWRKDRASVASVVLNLGKPHCNHFLLHLPFPL